MVTPAARTTLVDTLIVTVTATRTYRYVFGTNSYNDGTTDALSFDVEHLGLAQGAARDYYYNESWQVVEERKDGSDDAHTEYVWDLRYIDAPVLRWQDANGDGDTSDSGETLYYTNDANMNVTAVVDASGNVVERYMYDPYGNVTVLDADWSSDADGASDVGNEILYAGYRYDTETGLYHVRFRMYHPTLGRWMTRDLLQHADHLTLYEYVLSNPATFTDRFGLQAYRPAQTSPVGPRGRGDADHRNAGISWLEGVGSSDYLYTDVTGVGAYSQELVRTARDVSGWASSVWVRLLGVRGAYHPWFNTVFWSEGDRLDVLLHELTHAYDDLNDINLDAAGTFTAQQQAEALAYTAGYLAVASLSFRRVEAGIQAKEKCGNLRSYWRAAWVEIQGVAGETIKWGIWCRRRVTEQDVEDVFNKTGMHFSCPVLEWEYNQRMAALQIPDDWGPECCTFKCPDWLWPVFMAD